MERIGHLYKITRKSTGEYYYGVHKGSKFDGYWGSGTIIKKYVKTHGTDDLMYEIIEVGPYSKIVQLEEKIVTESEVKNPKCWNLKSGGYRGLLSEESRKLISLRNTGRVYSEDRNKKIQNSRKSKIKEIGAKISKSNKGRKRPLEERKKISESLLIAMIRHDVKNKLSMSKIGNKNPSWLGYVKTPDGIFESSIVAGLYYKKTDKTIRDRIKSKNLLFKDWYYIKEIPEGSTLITRNEINFHV